MSCVKVELAVLGSPSIISLMASVDVSTMKEEDCDWEMCTCESIGNRRWLMIQLVPGF